MLASLQWYVCMVTMGWRCSGKYSILLCRREGVQFPDQLILEKCVRALAFATFFGLRSTQLNDWETVIEALIRRVFFRRFKIFKCSPFSATVKPECRCNKCKNTNIAFSTGIVLFAYVSFKHLKSFLRCKNKIQKIFVY